MNSDICDLISMPMYGGSLETKTSFSTRTSMPSQFSNALTIVDTSSIWPFANRDNFKSRYNLMHALAIRNLCFHLNGYGYIDDTSKLGICTPYSAQAKLLKNILKNKKQKIMYIKVQKFTKKTIKTTNKNNKTIKTKKQ